MSADAAAPDGAAVGSVVVSKWGGENEMEVPEDLSQRSKSVWIESNRTSQLSSNSPLSTSAHSSLLTALHEEEGLTLVHEQEDEYDTEWNEIRDGFSWGRVRRYTDAIIAPDESDSVVYEDAIAIGLEDRGGAEVGTAAKPSDKDHIRPLVSTLAVQESVRAAKADAWVRVVGVAKYSNVSFVILQEYDGAGCVVALRGGELKTLFLVEVGMAFSDAMYRRSHEMWIGARYKLFQYRFATWTVETKDGLGPCAGQFHSCLAEAFVRLGYRDAGVTIVRQLERLKDGFEANSPRKLLDDAKQAAIDNAAVLREAIRREV